MLDLMWLECVSSSCKQDEGIDAMDWPARSPDLNPIEHIWDIMSRSIHQRHVAPQTVQELADADALVQVWEEIPQETIRHLIRSMPRRCRGRVPSMPSSVRLKRSTGFPRGCCFEVLPSHLMDLIKTLFQGPVHAQGVPSHLASALPPPARCPEADGPLFLA
ncbi:hypothetical protein L3Q82_007960 [Scortum barcoo]|uniref:Uncharacterized protein n=1 Tax=Scortum barcoo TaxID=214431 RepID=A0ACB8WKA9_9TELE|nr:hypothetical protein L3Q82_007960 [Scortum barcoo]